MASNIHLRFVILFDCHMPIWATVAPKKPQPLLETSRLASDFWATVAEIPTPDHPGQGVTIAEMAKFKLAKGKAKTAARPQGGLPCVVLVILAMFLVMFILYYAMKNANG